MDTEKNKYLCDCYYFDGACPSMGQLDTSREYGRVHRYYRRFCNSFGISPFDNRECPHCIVNGKPRMKRRESKNSEVKIIRVGEQ